MGKLIITASIVVIVASVVVLAAVTQPAPRPAYYWRE
jgi:hypothetical protein